jgi:GLPGLI family protein
MYMRKYLSGVVLLAAIMLVSEFAIAQNSFRGRITYNITYPGSNIDLAELQELPDKAVITTRNDQVRTELSGENAGLSQVKIADGNTGEVSTLLEIMREKYVITRSAREIQTALRNMPQPEFEFTGRTREILGYTCNHAIARIVDENGDIFESDIWYTEEIPGNAFNFDTPYYEIPGLMLEYEMRVGPLNIRYEASSVRRRMFVGSRNFTIPRDYQPITYDELREKLQGNF